MPRSPRSDLLMRHAGLRLRAVREMLEMEQRPFGARIGVNNPSTLANWEGGSRLPDVQAMVRLRGAFGISLDWVFAGSLVGMDSFTQDKLFEAAQRLGAAVGGPTPEFPAEVPTGPTGEPRRPPAAVPRPRPRGTTLHEPFGDVPVAPRRQP